MTYRSCIEFLLRLGTPDHLNHLIIPGVSAISRSVSLRLQNKKLGIEKTETNMITNKVINEIYNNYKKPPKDRDELRLDYFINLLGPIHHIRLSDDGEEIVIGDLDDFNPFKRFLVRRLTGVIEFDKTVAFAFDNHIIFLDKDDTEMRVHFKPEKQSFFGKIFGKK